MIKLYEIRLDHRMILKVSALEKYLQVRYYYNYYGFTVCFCGSLGENGVGMFVTCTDFYYVMFGL